MKRNDGSTVPLALPIDIARGAYQNVTYMNKFGFLPSQDLADKDWDVWEFAAQQPKYIYPDLDTAPIDSLSSSDAADTMDLEVLGLDINGIEARQVITLQGLTRVPLTTPLWRVYRMANFDINPTTGKGVDITGTVYCYEDSDITAGVPDDDTKVRAIIIGDNNQTQMAIYTIPRNKVGYVLLGEFGIMKSGGLASSGIMCYRSRAPGYAFRVFKTVGVSSGGSSNYKDRREIWDPIPPGTDIKLCSREVSANDSQVWGSFTIILVDEVSEAKVP